MGNFLNRLFGSESRETGCKRPFSKHNKVNLHNSSSKKSSPNAVATANHPVVNQEVVHRQEEESSHYPVPEPSVNPETSPFQRDFITAHQPLVSLEKSRPRRSNIRRSSRMNASIGKGDNVSRPLGHHQHQLSAVPSILGDDESTAIASHQSALMSNRADPSLPVVVSHNNQSVAPTPWMEQQQEILEEGESLEYQTQVRAKTPDDESTVDELSPNERRKVAHSRLTQMFIKREQTHKHISMIAPELPRGMHEERTSSSANTSPTTRHSTNGFIVNTDYERVYDKFGHYKADGDENENEDDFIPRRFGRPGASANVADESHSVHEQRKRVSHDDDEDELAVGAAGDVDDSEGGLPGKPEVTPRRKHMMHGNPMLIDELKKRQSTLYQAAVE